ncbi:hypothetical protein [Streptomyces narbonensis]|uniref:hypothetical protein n=1 Tax=Streptomyces narbonensis TaxID=67333 RepID=UPI001E4BA0FF|nr:hypothetical protein [Streptomyces narbonensis]
MRSYTKAANDIVRHRRMDSDAKILLLLVQGLPESACEGALSQVAEAELGWNSRKYRKAKKDLTESGFLHEWKWQDGRGRWVTQQLLSNVTLTRDEASSARKGNPPESPSGQTPTVGSSGGRKTGSHLPVDEDCEKNTPHPPPEARAEREPSRDPSPEPGPAPEAAPEADATPSDDDPELFEAERLLLSLRHSHKDLLLGVREARGLADQAAEWLRRGVSAADLRRALTAYLPSNGVRSAVGFLRHRLTEKMPVPDAPPKPPTRPALVACESPDASHVFRPVAGETWCGPCRRDAAWEEHEQSHGLPRSRPDDKPVPWRERFDRYVEGAVT